MNTEESPYVRAWRLLGGAKRAEVSETAAPAAEPQASPKRRRKSVTKPLPAVHGADAKA
jgi:hypothetical protein